MAMSDFLEDTVLEMVLNSVAYSEPASVYVALSKGDIEWRQDITK